jgi:hypothetical protein
MVYGVLQLFLFPFHLAHARTKPTRQRRRLQCRAVVVYPQKSAKQSEQPRAAPGLVIVHVPDTSAQFISPFARCC